MLLSPAILPPESCTIHTAAFHLVLYPITFTKGCVFCEFELSKILVNALGLCLSSMF